MESPPPFAFVTPDQQVQPFGKSLGAKKGHARPFNLRVDDIPGAAPRTHCFATAPRLTDPLEPCYQLPHSQHIQPALPAQKFIRNAIDNSDIPGAQVHASCTFASSFALHLQVCQLCLTIVSAVVHLCKQGSTPFMSEATLLYHAFTSLRLGSFSPL